MALVSSTMLPLGTPAPDFSLLNTLDGKMMSLPDFAGAKSLLVVFLADHCPYAQHTAPGIIELAREYQPKGLQVVAISASDVSAYPDDSPERMKALAQEKNYPFPYLYDESQATALAYTAACTPDLFLFGPDRKLVYRGRFDDSSPGNTQPLTGKDLRVALDQVLAGQPVSGEQNPSIGCSIKWKPGNEPAYLK